MAMTVRVARVTCTHDCPDACAMRVTVRDGRAVDVAPNPEHPVTGHHLCVKVDRYLERVYHPDRLLTPLRRTGPKGRGAFERVSWDDALDIVVRPVARDHRRARPGRHPPLLVSGQHGDPGRVRDDARALPPAGRHAARAHDLRRSEPGADGPRRLHVDGSGEHRPCAADPGVGHRPGQHQHPHVGHRPAGAQARRPARGDRPLPQPHRRAAPTCTWRSSRAPTARWRWACCT